MTFLEHALWLPLPLLGLLFLYFLVDKLFRSGWALFGKQVSRTNSFLLSTVGLFSVIGLVWPYAETFSPQLRLFATAVALLLAYNASTRDLDPTKKGALALAQALVVPVALLSYFSPALLILTGLLLSHFLRFWLHHATFPMRLLTALVAGSIFSSVQSLAPFRDTAQALWTSPAPLVLLLVIIQVSHYFITALAKSFLGRRPYSWMFENRLHYLAASSYSWGWARFVPWSTWKKFIHALRRVEIPLQVAVFALELSAPLALIHSHAAMAFSLAFAGFHLGVFAVAGLLFWDWIVSDLLIYGLLLALPKSVLSEAFGLAPLMVGTLVLFALPLRHRLWKPMPLGWFDTPLTARIHWRVIGESGTTYGLYNDFMCPHERLYGRVHGCFYAPHPVLTYHLGEVWKSDLRANIERAGADPKKLDALRERYGILPRSEKLRALHEGYLQAFFSHLNAGAKKSILPVWLRFLKAPGDQIFYFGDLPAYQRQEAARTVSLRFVEEVFDGEHLVRLCDKEVARIDIPTIPPEHCPEELTPKALDNYLLTLAQGRLIDLPGFQKNYTEVLSEV